MEKRLTTEDLSRLRTKFKQSKKAIQSMLKQYKYQDNCSHAENMKKLYLCLDSVMNAENMDDFCKYLSNEDHLPIQANFKIPRLEYLQQMFEDWLLSKEEHSFMNLERLDTVNFRNLLFKRIFLEEKEAINEHFLTLSSKNMLKGFDLYQLLTELLSSYYLYEFNSDGISFFEKINSFQSFIKIVDGFINCGRRIIIKSHLGENDKNYIRRYEFQSLIEYWEGVNHELTLMETPKKNMNDFGIQTTITNSVNIGTQTVKEDSTSFLELINKTIRQINVLIEKENKEEVLVSLNNIFDVLRREKILAVKINERSTLQLQNLRQEISVSSITPQTQFETPSAKKPNRSKSPFAKKQAGIYKPASHIKSNRSADDCIKKTYQIIRQESSFGQVGLNELQILFYHFGLVQAHESFLINNLMDNGFIQDPDSITYFEFKNIIKQLLKQSDKLTIANLQLFIKEKSQQAAMWQAASIRSPTFKFKEVRENANLSPKVFNLLERRKNNNILSSSTYQPDSEDFQV